MPPGTRLFNLPSRLNLPFYFVKFHALIDLPAIPVRRPTYQGVRLWRFQVFGQGRAPCNFARRTVSSSSFTAALILEAGLLLSYLPNFRVHFTEMERGSPEGPVVAFC